MLSLGLTSNELLQLEEMLEWWFLQFYEGGSWSPWRRRKLQRRRDSREVTVDIEIVSQKVAFDENDIPTNEITYNQRITYRDPPKPPANLREGETNGSPVFIDDFSSYQIATEPFRDFEALGFLGTELKNNIDALKNVELPLEPPIYSDTPTSGYQRIHIVFSVMILVFELIIVSIF